MSYTAADRDFINPRTLQLYCNSNAHLLTAPPSAFVLEFPGLGGCSCMGGTAELAPYGHLLAPDLAEQGILLAYTFPGPWSWMNRSGVRVINALVAAIREAYGLTEATPWAVMGGSMGGLGALIYAAAGAYTPTACLSVCPCVDVPACYPCVPDIPRTLFCAVADLELPIAEGLKTISPRHRVADMPHIPYHIVCDCADALFPEEMTDAYVDELRAAGHTVTYHRLAGCPHGAITEAEWAAIRAFLTGHLCPGHLCRA